MAFLLAVASPACAQEAAVPTRAVALTIDDLPVGRNHSLAWMQRVTRDLLDQITAADVPAIGFVNEGKLAVPGEEAERTALLQAWVDAGLDLGNHTYSHYSLFRTPLDTFTADVLRGEVVTDQLLAARGDSARYFRHPYLNTGPDAATRDALAAWLATEGYTVAPVTHDNAEYLYAHAYDIALDAGDDALQARIVEAYLAHMDSTAAHYEGLSRELFGREPPQIVLIHANALHADHLDKLLAIYRRRGYRFVPLAEALADPVYTSEENTYSGPAGFSWLQRWALTRGMRLTPEPATDPWIEALAASGE